MITPRIPAVEAPRWLAAPVEAAGAVPEAVLLALDPVREALEPIYMSAYQFVVRQTIFIPLELDPEVLSEVGVAEVPATVAESLATGSVAVAGKKCELKHCCWHLA